MPKPRMFNKNNYLKATDVKEGDLLKFIDAGSESESQMFKYPDFTMAGKPHPLAGQPKRQFNIGIELGGGEKKTLTLNATSFKNLAVAWGEDTDEWVGKIAKITLVTLATMKKCIVLEPGD